MPTTLNIDQHLLDEAKRLGGHHTKRATINEALREYIQRLKRRGALKAFDSFDFDPDFNYKEERKLDSSQLTGILSPWPISVP